MQRASLASIHLGQPWPLGASVTERGVNFSLVAPLASHVELLLFAGGNDPEPQRVVELDARHRSGDHWHVEVEGPAHAPSAVGTSTGGSTPWGQPQTPPAASRAW